MLKVGDKAPDFSVKTHLGKTLRLSDLHGKSVILWFYPKADTPGCTAEGCGFRDRLAKFKEKNVVVLGVSFDTEQENAKFAEKFSFPFELLCDTKREVGMAYGACKTVTDSNAKRIGYVIDPKGLIKYANASVDARTFPETVLAEV